MKHARTSFTLTLAAGALVLQGAAALTACGGGGSGSGGSAATTGAGAGTTTTSSSTTTTKGTGGMTATTGGTGGTGTGGTGTGGTGAGGMASDAGSDGGSLCTQTGGTESMTLCCASQGDYPDTCTTGACGCAPSSSHMVRSCTCPGSKCYDPTKGCTPQI